MSGNVKSASEFKELIQTIADDINEEDEAAWTVTEDEYRLILDIKLSDGRHQKVVIITDEDIAGQQIARYWTAMGPAELVDAERCLEENANLDYGHFAKLEEDLVLMDTQLLADADPLELGSAITYLASYADRFEEALYGVDEH